jgi:hypothetical protein
LANLNDRPLLINGVLSEIKFGKVRDKGRLPTMLKESLGEGAFLDKGRLPRLLKKPQRGNVSDKGRLPTLHNNASRRERFWTRDACQQCLKKILKKKRFGQGTLANIA